MLQRKGIYMSSINAISSYALASHAVVFPVDPLIFIITALVLTIFVLYLVRARNTASPLSDGTPILVSQSRPAHLVPYAPPATGGAAAHALPSSPIPQVPGHRGDPRIVFSPPDLFMASSRVPLQPPAAPGSAAPVRNAQNPLPLPPTTPGSDAAKRNT